MTMSLCAMTFAAATVLLAPVADTAAGAAPTERTVYVTVTDGRGGAVPDLTAADLVVKEGGKEREITKAAPASAKMRLTLAVEERLIADASIRQAIFEFMKRLTDYAEIRMITIGLRNHTVADYTGSLDVLVSAINKFTLNPNKDSNVAEGVLEIADHYADNKVERPVLVVLALSGGQAGVDGRTVLEKLRQSGAIMYSATLAWTTAGPPNSDAVGMLTDQSSREQVLGDGPKQSGGRRIEVPSTGAFPRSLQQVSDELRSQYAVTYVLPDGVKPDKRFAISSKRKGINLRAPSAIPDR
jgi:hypothetical protein